MKSTFPNWGKYWQNISDLVLLKYKLNNLDETLQLVEKEFDTKLLSGDQMDLVEELENRIDALVKLQQTQSTVVQGNLFENE